MNVAAPIFGTRKIAKAMKTAPNSPPLHAYQGIRPATMADRIGSRMATASITMNTTPEEVAHEPRPGGRVERSPQVGVKAPAE